MELKEIENEINKIKERNFRVESDKAWESSWTRKIFIAALTYLLVALLFIVLGLPEPWLSALVPTVGFILSTLSLAAVKRIWLKRRTHKSND